VPSLNLEAKATQQTFATLVGVTRSAVVAAVSEGILTPGQSYKEWLLAYCKRLREMAAGRYSAGDLDLTEERARLARAQSERIEMENAVKRGELAPIDTLRDAIIPAMTQISALMDAIPVKLKREAPHLTATDLEIVKREIANAMNLAAQVRYEPDA
jgi:terminase small subunit / prophage DNA-packing protein